MADEVTPARRSRRAAPRRQTIVESSDDGDANTTQQDSEEEYTPAPPTTSRRRKASEVPVAPRTATKSRRTRASQSVEPLEMATPSRDRVSVEPEAESTTKPSSTRRGRRNVRESRRSRLSVAPNEPEPTPRRASRATPLSDITGSFDHTSNINNETELQSEATPRPKRQQSIEENSENTEALARQKTARETSEKPDHTPQQESAKADNHENTKRETSASPQPDKLAVPPASQAPIESPMAARIDPRAAMMERPMDIAARARAAAQPLSQEPQPPKARMVITWLVLTNFKSYAGRQEVGPFHSSFSAVVGPNGSGKSNVIDSLLFVFGFRASKMRQSKISALIHNSAGHPNLDYCEVEVQFQEVKDLPGGGSEAVPDTGLRVSRRAFKNNSSKYYVNGKESNFTVVTALLRDRGIDLDHKRFLILQGEVESIATMKPKAPNEHEDGLLEYLEDIIGTSKYKAPIEEAATEVERLNEVCQEKHNRVQHVEREKDSLEDKKNKALAYVRDENELASKQSALWQLFMSETQDNIQVTQEAVDEIQGSLNEELERHQGRQEEIKNMEKQHKTSAKEFEKLNKQTQELLKDLAKIDKENVKFEEKKKFLTNKQKKLQKVLETSRFGVSEGETHIQQADDDIERNTAQIEELREKMEGEEEQLNEIRENLKGKTQHISDDIAKKQKSLEPWNDKINEHKSNMAVAQSELDILREKDGAGAVAIAETEAKIAALQESKETKQAELEECRSEKRRTEKEIKKVQNELASLLEQEPTIRTKLSSARQRADEARSNLSASQSQGKVLTGLMRLKESGRINGFHGRLGNLGAIDGKYDVAISTACPQLNNLVVDSVGVGEQCIEYLRKNDLGRANFMLLDRLAQRDLSPIKTPEDAPRLFDLVKPKHDRFRPAFYSALQNTLVADDLAQANRIAYGAKRWRVVTLDGQLIDKSGTMSGGGNRVLKGAMSSKLAADVTKEQVAKLETDRDSVEKTLQELQQEQRQLETTLRQLNDTIPKLETKEQKAMLEMESYDRNEADLKRRIKDIAAESQPSKTDKARRASLEKNIASMEKEIGKLHEETSSVEEEIKALQDKIMEIGGIKLRTQKAKVDMLKEQIDTLTEEMSRAEVSKAKAQKQVAKQEKAHREAEAELENLAGEMEKVEEDMRTQMKDSSGAREQAEEAQYALEERKEALEALKSELDAKIAELNETRGVEIEMKNKLEEHKKSLKENQMRLKHWEDKLGKLTLTNVSDLGEEGESEAPPSYTKDELQDMDKAALKKDIAALEEKTQNVQVELGVLSEYRRRVEEHAARSADLSQAVSERDTNKKRCEELRSLRLEGFMEGLTIIGQRLKEMYQMITMGGNALLELVDTMDPFSEGINFSVMPPRKGWKNISNLSGGEKTLSSLALVFALHHYKPTPLYVMDEIDAALDFRNISIVANYISERTKNAQFIVISLRNNMFESAVRLVGIYKVNHMTKSVTVENKDYIVARARPRAA
ncbi:nuclear condensin-like protein complex subunit Smc4 [Phyllosticta citriasiana]|uniref:Structural maintenance of chromosomes protein n=1 Tax=Phyllosticta citriasiana TaxID=595635 RepID=A0ABR1KR49_9PEZI